MKASYSRASSSVARESERLLFGRGNQQTSTNTTARDSIGPNEFLLIIESGCG